MLLFWLNDLIGPKAIAPASLLKGLFSNRPVSGPQKADIVIYILNTLFHQTPEFSFAAVPERALLYQYLPRTPSAVPTQAPRGGERARSRAGGGGRCEARCREGRRLRRPRAAPRGAAPAAPAAACPGSGAAGARATGWAAGAGPRAVLSAVEPFFTYLPRLLLSASFVGGGEDFFSSFFYLQELLLYNL